MGSARIKMLTVGAAYVLALAIIAVGVDRAIAFSIYRHPSHFVPKYRSGYHSSVGWKMHQLSQLDKQHLNGIFFGNSLTMMDVDPTTLDKRLATQGLSFTSYNMAIPSVGVDFWPTFVKRVLGSSYPPILLLGLQPRDADADGASFTAALNPQFYGSGAYTDAAANTLTDKASEALDSAYILWGRSGSFLAALGSFRAGLGRYDPDDIRVVNDAGWGVAPSRFDTPAASLVLGRTNYDKVPAGQRYVMHAAATAAFRRLASLARARHGLLIVFTMPMFYDRTPGETPARAAQFTQQMRALSRKDKFAFLDLRHELGSQFEVGDFADANHLQERGAQRFSTLLANAVAPLVRPILPRRAQP